MERPDIIGWEITTNENGVKMATLPQSKMYEIVEYMKYAESKLKKLRVTDVSGSVCKKCGVNFIPRLFKELTICDRCHDAFLAK